MGRSWLLCISACLALQAVLWWSLGRSQVPGFISIDCGSNDTTIYKDENGIEWAGDSDLIAEGTPRTITGAGSLRALSTMRVFDGNQSKYCYNLTDSAIKEGDVYMVRATFWVGNYSPPNTTQDPSNFQFKLIVDADIWDNVTIPYGSKVWQYHEIYMRAQRNSIDVCFARSTPDGDAPFVSALEVRPLLSTLMSIEALLSSNRIFVLYSRVDYGVSSTSTSTIIRYPLDDLDRLWRSSTTSPPYIMETTHAISTEQQDKLPAKILQNAFTSASFTISISNMNPKIVYFVELFFAEISPAVNASGQRAFNILLNGELQTTSGPIDVFNAVGANAAYGYRIVASPDKMGVFTLSLTPTATSIYQPYLAAAEYFYTQYSYPVTDANTDGCFLNVHDLMSL